MCSCNTISIHYSIVLLKENYITNDDIPKDERCSLGTVNLLLIMRPDQFLLIRDIKRVIPLIFNDVFSKYYFIKL